MDNTMTRAPTVRGVAKSMEGFVLIRSLGNSSGEISQILLQMFRHVCMLGIGVGPFDLNENAPQRVRAQASLSSALPSKSESVFTYGFSQIPLQSLPSVVPCCTPFLAQAETIWHPVKKLHNIAYILWITVIQLKSGTYTAFYRLWLKF